MGRGLQFAKMNRFAFGIAAALCLLAAVQQVEPIRLAMSK